MDKSKKTALLIIIACALLVAALFCGLGILIEQLTLNQATSFYHEEPPILADVTSEVEEEEQNQELAENLEEEEKKEELEPRIDFVFLKEKYPDTVAYLTMDAITGVVVQASDNDYYLNHLPDKSYNKQGAIFLDYEVNSDFSGQSVILYGHNMRNGGVFGSLSKFRNREYLDENSVFEFETPYKRYKATITHVFLHDGNRDFPLSFESEEDFDKFIKNVDKKSVLKTEETLTFSDKIIILATCAYDYNNARLALLARLD